MKRLIVTISSGDCINYDDISIPSMSAYAKRIGADLMVLRQPVFGDVFDATWKAPGCPAFWKIPMISWFGKQELYDVMVYIDADIFISSQAPDIFREVQKDDPSFHLCPDMQPEPEAVRWWKWVTDCYPEVKDWPHPFRKPVIYHNSGVMLFTRRAAQLAGEFIPHDTYYSRYFEQDYLLLLFARIGGVVSLPPHFNQPIPWRDPLSDAKQGMWHTCGLQQDGKRDWFQQFKQYDIWLLQNS